MSSTPASPKPTGTGSELDRKDREKAETSPVIEFPSETSSEELHFASRKDELLPDEDNEKRQIVGYDAGLMRARALLSSVEEKKLLRRIDWRLIPLLSIMYMVKSVDAINVSNARIMDRGTPRNIMTELHMSANQYNWVVTSYYIPYILAEAPSNLIVKWMRPSRFQARIMISWGVVLCCHAAVKNRQGLYVVRAFLGLFEAGLWPGTMLHLCYWYRPDEVAPRVVLVTLLGNFSTVISGLLAFAFNGVTAGGLSGWKWLILTEGIFTVLLGVAVLLFLPDFAATAPWLTNREKAFITARLPINAPRSSESDFSWQEFLGTLKDTKLWLFLSCWAFYTIGTTGLGFYQPTVIANLGFTSIGKAQLLNLPSAVFAVGFTIIFGLLSNTGRIPQPLIPLSFMIVIEACYVVLYTFPNTGGVYTATILAGGLSTAWYTMMWPWRVQTTEGATGSAFAIAFANSYGQIGGAIGAHLFNSKFAPKYATSFGIAMGFIGMAIVMNLITWRVTYRVDVETRKLKRKRVEAAKRNEALLDDVDIHAGGKTKA